MKRRKMREIGKRSDDKECQPPVLTFYGGKLRATGYHFKRGESEKADPRHRRAKIDDKKPENTEQYQRDRNGRPPQGQTASG